MHTKRTNNMERMPSEIRYYHSKYLNNAFILSNQKNKDKVLQKEKNFYSLNIVSVSSFYNLYKILKPYIHIEKLAS